MRAEPDIQLIGASAAHVGRIAHRLRADDLREVTATDRSAKTALRLSLGLSSWAITVLLDGDPHAMFGVSCVSIIEDKGRPWFLGSDKVYDHPRQMLGMGRRIIARMHESFRYLENIVSQENVRAIRMLRAWGFTVGGDVMMIGNVPFVLFWKDGDV